MQIEVHDEEKGTVWCDVQCCGEITEVGFGNQRVIFRRILPNGAERPAMSDRDVIKLSIGRDDDPVWTINVYGHVAGVDLSSDASAIRPEPNQRNLVG